MINPKQEAAAANKGAVQTAPDPSCYSDEVNDAPVGGLTSGFMALLSEEDKEKFRRLEQEFNDSSERV